MQIEKLILNNFRCFEHLEFACDPHLNVIVGTNASGKTALLKALRLCLGTFVGKFSDLDLSEKSGMNITAEDVRFDSNGKFAAKTSFQCHAIVGTEQYYWEKEKEGRNGKTTSKGTNAAGDLVKSIESRLRHATQTYDQDLPLVAYFSTDRVSAERKFTKEDKLFSSRVRGYFNALGSFTNIEYLKEWFKNRQLEKFQHSKQQSAALDLMQQIVRFMPDVVKIEYIIAPSDKPSDEVSESDLYLSYKDGRKIGFEFLSDGQKSFIALLTDIAMRCWLLNPHMGMEANQTEGVVLIDEVDLHLHPEWQRMVIPVLSQAFPNIQFFITTHSPQVVSSIKKESLFILKDYKIEKGNVYVEGRDTNSLLMEVFGEQKRPANFQKYLNEFYQILEEKDEKKALVILDQLEKTWGNTDPDVVRANLYYQDLIDEIHTEAH